MTVVTAKLPGDVEDTFRLAIQNLDDQDIKNRGELINAGLQSLPIYVLDLEDVEKERFPGKNSGWLLAPTGQGEKVAASVPALMEVAVAGEPNTKPQFLSFSQGKGAKAFFDKLVKILNNNQFAVEGLELRFLRIPSMLVSAFWIASTDPKNDKIVVIRGPSVLPVEGFLSPPKFFSTLQPLVEKFRGFTAEKA